jgi:plasmid stabilization system protein ParE
VSRLVYSPRATQDLERLQDFLREQDLDMTIDVARTIVHAISVLEHHPLIGRPVEEGLHELVISRGRTGYVALYDYLSVIDTVVVLALRHQREAGYE